MLVRSISFDEDNCSFLLDFSGSLNVEADRSGAARNRVLGACGLRG